MRETLSKYKEQVRKQVLAKDKLCVIVKAPNGRMVDVYTTEWIDTPVIPVLQEEARLNKEEYETELKKVEQEKFNRITLKFEELIKELDQSNAVIKQLQEHIVALEHEIKVIKGEVE